MNDIWWDVLAVYAGYVLSFVGCGIVMPLGTILFSQFKLWYYQHGYSMSL
jgi:hypothetical protein